METIGIATPNFQPSRLEVEQQIDQQIEQRTPTARCCHCGNWLYVFDTCPHCGWQPCDF